jgi:hypothetical protein
MNHDGGAEGMAAQLHAFALLRRCGADTRKYDGAPATEKKA